MASIDIFNDDAFSMSSLTAAINALPYLPGRLGSLGLFDEEGITTTVVQIEKDGDTLALVAAGERGAPGQIVAGTKRQLIPFNTVHLPQRSSIRADEVQGLRQFGSETELESVQTLVGKRQAKHRRQLDATIEFHRLGAVKGQILDADGQRVLLDLYQAFGIQQKTVAMELADANTHLRSKCLQIHEAIEDALGAIPHACVRAVCGKNFWAALLANADFEATYLNSELAAALRGEPREAIEFGGIVFERYRGKVGSTAFVGDDEAYAIPEGVPELFITRYAPADHIDTVNTNGLPYYTSQEIMPHGKGVELESQANPLNLCTRPGAVIKLTK
ncbi:MAG: major capsid protein [Pseudogulbenkiania sp.]|nr:major capsid protein [Pseudogulbenkiania sp.]